ncbi:hypothetical protein HY522_02770 [bacterium]|nr:hypothetical protein [bacterium]
MNEASIPGQSQGSAGDVACAVCSGHFGQPEVHFHASVNGSDALICPRCLHILIHGMSIADARVRMGLS